MVRPRGLVRALLIAAAIGGCGPSSTAGPGPVSSPASGATHGAAPSPPAALVTSDTPAQRLDRDIRYLASPELAGRGTGEPGARLAADFIARRFTELGLAPAGDANASSPSYLQRFSARVGAKVSPPSFAVEHNRNRIAPAADAFVTADGSASGTASGEAVFVGYGITATALGWDDYAGASLAGKVAILLDGAPELSGEGRRPDSLKDFGTVRYKLRTAREHGAAGAVVISASDTLPLVPADASSMGIPGVVLRRSAAVGLWPRLALDQPAAWQPNEPVPIKPLPRTTLSLTARIEPSLADAWNVVAMLKAPAGSKAASEWVVVGAHYDHLGHGGTSASRAPGVKAIHPGADDNASGTALLLEVARRMSLRKQRPSRNLIFIAFGAEEVGALGSRYWVEHPSVPIASVTAMINADMVGRLRSGRLVVDGTGTAAEWPALVRTANAGVGLDLVLGTEGFGASDHTSFTAARVPVAFLFTGVHDDYHLPTDTADKINAGGIAQIAAFATKLVELACEQPQRLAFVDAPADPHRGMRGGFRVSLGTIPDYAFQGRGVRLTGVRPDAPAARSGMRAGDIIVKVGSHEITNVHDYTFVLRELEPGRETAIEIEREGKRVVVRVIPAPGR